MMDIAAFGTPFGLAFASGWNAYLPLLAFALSVRWWHLYSVSPSFTFITQTWFLAALVFLTILDFVAEKLPFIDQAWNTSQGIIRPLAGALVALSASNHALTTLSSAMLPDHSAGRETLVALSILPTTGVGPLAILLIGGVFAALSHRTKTLLRIVSMLTTVGFLNGVLSLLEDGLVVIVILLSLFAPTLMFFLLVLLVVSSTRQLLRLKNL